MPPSKNYKNTQKDQKAESWLRCTGYSTVDINRLLAANKIAFIKKNHVLLSKVCKLKCADIVASLCQTNGEKNLASFMKYYYALKKLGFSQENLRDILLVESAHQSIEIIIEKSDQLFGAPLKLNPDQVTYIGAWPEGNLNISTLLQYKDIALELGLADGLEYFTTRAQRETFVTDLAEVIITDRLLYGVDSDGATTVESVSLSLSPNSSAGSVSSSPLSIDRQDSLQHSHSFQTIVPPYQPSVIDTAMIPRDVKCQNQTAQIVDVLIDERPYKRHRPGIVLMPMDEIDTKDVIDSFLILFAGSDSIRYATNSLCNLLDHMESRKILNESLNQWLMSNDTNMRSNVLKFICTLMLDVESDNKFVKGLARHGVCELLHDTRTKDNVMAAFNQWLQSDDAHWNWLARETIKSLLAIGPSATVIVPTPSQSVVITSSSLSNSNYGHNSVGNVGQDIRTRPQFY